MLDPTIRAMATGKNFGMLALHLADGQIANHVMWVDATEDQLLVNTEIHRPKYKAMQQQPDVTITIWDNDNPYRYAEVRGRVNGQVRGDAARAHIDALSQRYLGTDYAGEIQSERVILRVDPVRQRTHG